MAIIVKPSFSLTQDLKDLQYSALFRVVVMLNANLPIGSLYKAGISAADDIT